MNQSKKARRDTLSLRWIIKRDLEEVLEIENDSFLFPWTRKELIEVLRERDSIGMVMEYQEKVIGYVLYHLQYHWIEILNIAVHRDYRRMMIGTAMIEKLKSKLVGKRHKLVAAVNEGNLEAQLWFRENEFRCTEIVKGMFTHQPTLDCYWFEFDADDKEVLDESN